MNKLPEKIQELNESIKILSQEKSFSNTQNVINNLVSLFGIESKNEWKLFTDSQGKIRSNAGWFMEAEGFADRRASYKISNDNLEKIDLKVYWVKKPKKSIISWLVALTPNFEDEPFYGNLNVGIDFVIPEKSDKVIVVLSKNYVIRTLELSGELTITQQEIFSKWLQEFDFTNKAQVHEILWQSFDIEPLNKRFYKEVSSFFVELKQHLIKEKVFDDKHASYFVNRLIGRLVFCWFLDKKGIINDKIDYFNTSGKNSTEYYREKLETLFFKVFNTPIEDREKSIDNITPFLNGGLFEEKLGDKHGDPKLTFPADYFDRLVDFLHHYNFTTDESTSTFQQVAIDPEMLGRIFENLLAEQTEETGEQARKAKGAFYTPREIVDYMSRESLRQYLKNKLGDEGKSFELIDNLLDSKEHDWRDQQRNYRDKLKPYKYDILKALDEIKILDPACGSGAFPMGMLSLLLQTYERLDATFDSYKKKLEIIKNNLHGVDIEPMAVEISRLRAWLSIVVDEDVDSNKIKPLPNLDFKFVCANSLIPLDANKQTQMLDQADKLEEEMQEIREKYFNARSPKVKEALKIKFNKLLEEKNQGNLFGKSKKLEQLQSYHPFDNEQVTEFFDPEFMFGIKDGFDVVIGNPPYVEHKKLKGIASQLKPIYEVYTSSSDLSVYFYEKGLKILKENGIQSYICTNKFFSTDYGKKLRKFLSKKQILQIINFEQVPIFENVLVSSCVTITQNKKQEGVAKVIEYRKLKKWREVFPPVNSDFNSFDYTTENEWRIKEDRGADILDKIQKKGIPLKDYESIVIRRGVTTGYDPAFVIDEKNKSKFETDYLKPLFLGRDIKRYKNKLSNKALLFVPWHYPLDIESFSGSFNESEEKVKNIFPKLYNHLVKHKEGLSKRNKAETGIRYEWYALQRCAASYFEEFENEKIIWPLTANEWGFTIDNQKHFLTSGAFFLVSKDISLQYILGILNSSLMKFYFSLIGVMTAGGAYTLKKSTIERFPISAIISSNQHFAIQLESIVKQILKTKKENPDADTSELEEEIDKLVYKLYDLTDEEIKVIEENS